MSTFLLTWNPQKWSWDDAERALAAGETEQGRGFPDRWSIGGRTSGIESGDRVFLLRQGEEPRGVVASGTATSGPFTAAHWDNTPGRLANYVDVDWDRVVNDDAVLPTPLLLSELPGTHWNTQSSGIVILPPNDARLEAAWRTTVAAASGDKGPPSSQAWQNDPVKRKAAEDLAQHLLEEHFRADGWAVRDTRYGNPFDAVATKATERVFLEAKGTQSSGQRVLVTPGEVAFARKHKGECVMGIVSGIRFRDDGTPDEGSGELRLLDWNPDQGDLMATGYLWRPSEPE